MPIYDNPRFRGTHDDVDHPPHYDLPGAGIEVEQAIDVIFAAGWGMEFCAGNILKYMTRAGRKLGEADVKDLKKVAVYAAFMVNYLETGHPRKELKSE